MNEYLGIYFVGCALVVLLSLNIPRQSRGVSYVWLVKFALYFVLAWMTKANVLAKNLKKINPPEEAPLLTRAAGFVFVMAIEAALSWINVALLIFWQIPAIVFGTLRDVFTSTPESIKVLRYPLRNNPDMSAEAVWAHMYALAQAAGANTPNLRALLSDLADTKAQAPSFSKSVALEQLSALKVVNAALIADADKFLADARANSTDEEF